MRKATLHPAALEQLRLFHYFERRLGPFVNLSDLPPAAAAQILAALREAGTTFASQRAPDYLAIRRALERQVRRRFQLIGGRPRRAHPHYLTVGACPWLRGWYIEGCELSIPITAFAPEIISFTYGDMFPALRLPADRPYRGQVYRLADVPEVIAHFGLPQEWNRDGQAGPERYIEAQVWDDRPLRPFRAAWLTASG